MAKKKTMTTMFMAMASLLVLLMISTFHVDSVLGGEMGGYARSSSSRSSHDTITVYSHQSYCTSIPRTTHQKLNSSSPSTDSKSERNAIMIAFFAVLFIVVMIFSSQSKDSVLMVQVAFDGATDQIERDLDLISMVSDTPTALGLHLMLSSVNMKRPWKEIFDRTYEEERKKVNTLVGVNDFRKGIRCKTATCPNKKYVIMTILVAASVRRELPTINCYSDLDKALQILTSIDHKSIEAVKVLWTSQDDIEDFPSLKHVKN
ncbi:hypothetical protein TEA_003219 [Camellia sinensis var. sinensis]|uniref:Uncharacterized protein n=1 Tax=Camellia sinensis var. sinensis TaxID=542762 RepID=A0A4S4DW94_CAMSN|nr:hypothetical protein TEA_003219 [Camellia sinensis var. sinensis]